MRIAIGIYGASPFDPLIVQSRFRCLFKPLEKHFQEEHVDILFFLHCFFLDVQDLIPILHQHPFQEISLSRLPSPSQHQSYDHNHFSLQQVNLLWRRHIHTPDLVILLRGDLLLTRPIAFAEIDIIARSLASHDHQLFLVRLNQSSEIGLALGSPHALHLYGDNPTHSDSNLFLHYIFLIMIRVLPSLSLHPHDLHLCPYLEDLLHGTASSHIYIPSNQMIHDEDDDKCNQNI